MDNGISQRQNSPDNIRLLAAQSSLYSVAKRFAATQCLLVGATPVLGAMVVAKWTHADTWVALIGLAVAVADSVWLDSVQDTVRSRAATIQESFDCGVLQLPWNHAIAGHRPTPEGIHEASQKYKSHRDSPLENWYPVIVSTIPLHQARVICQRTNCWWDSELRRRYSKWIIVLMTILGLGVFVVALATGLSLQKFVLAVVAPLMPAGLWASREHRRQTESSLDSDRLREFAESLWGEVIVDSADCAEATRRSRELQDAIFIRRKRTAPVFDWVYQRLRTKQEDQMNIGAQQMVDQLNRADSQSGMAR